MKGGGSGSLLLRLEAAERPELTLVVELTVALREDLTGWICGNVI